MKPFWLAGFLTLLSLACQRQEEAHSGSSSKKETPEASAKARTSKTTDRGSTKKTIPTAEPVPDKPGFVKSPYNGKVIDVTGVPAGTVMDDPGYPSEEEKQFRVPQMADVEEPLKGGVKVESLPILDMEARADARTAKVVQGKPGFVISPWDQREIDASAFEPGSIVTDPSSTREEPRFLRIPDDHQPEGSPGRSE